MADATQFLGLTRDEIVGLLRDIIITSPDFLNAKLLGETRVGTIYDENEDSSLELAVGSENSSPAASRTTDLWLAVPHSGSKPGKARVAYVHGTGGGLAWYVGLLGNGDYNFSTNSANVARLTQAGEFGCNGGAFFGQAALSTTATTGHMFIPSSAGPPTGTPVAIPVGQVAFQFDSANNKLYIYTGSAWISTAVLT